MVVSFTKFITTKSILLTSKIDQLFILIGIMLLHSIALKPITLELNAPLIDVFSHINTLSVRKY